MTRMLNCVLCGKTNFVGGDYVECIDSNDFCGVCQVHCLCKGNGDAQACEAAGANRDVNLPDLARLSAEAVQDITDGSKNLRTVSDWCGKSGFCKDFFAESYCNGANSTGGFNS